MAVVCCGGRGKDQKVPKIGFWHDGQKVCTILLGSKAYYVSHGLEGFDLGGMLQCAISSLPHRSSLMNIQTSMYITEKLRGVLSS